MIIYQDSYCGISLVCQRAGSVFPHAAALAIVPALLTITLSILLTHVLEDFDAEEFMPMDTLSRLYNTFTWVFGFVLVFRTGVAYNRYWDGNNKLREMGAEWYDACSQIMCMSQASLKDGVYTEAVRDFHGAIVRLFSLLHCTALQHIAIMEDESFEVIDLEGLDKRLLTGLLEMHDPLDKMQVVFHWIQHLILDAVKNGMISTPPPIVSRIFQELNTGMVAHAKMALITFTPFPFPYAQMIGSALIIHWMLTPLLFGTIPMHFMWSGMFAFISVFALCALNMIAIEIEQPFGDDPNDIDIAQAQTDMNRALLLLLQPSTRAHMTFKAENASSEVKAQIRSGGLQASLSTKRLSQAMPKEMSDLAVFNPGLTKRGASATRYGSGGKEPSVKIQEEVSPMSPEPSPRPSNEPKTSNNDSITFSAAGSESNKAEKGGKKGFAPAKSEKKAFAPMLSMAGGRSAKQVNKLRRGRGDINFEQPKFAKESSAESAVSLKLGVVDDDEEIITSKDDALPDFSPAISSTRESLCSISASPQVPDIPHPTDSSPEPPLNSPRTRSTEPPALQQPAVGFVKTPTRLQVPGMIGSPREKPSGQFDRSSTSRPNENTQQKGALKIPAAGGQTNSASPNFDVETKQIMKELVESSHRNETVHASQLAELSAIQSKVEELLQVGQKMGDRFTLPVAPKTAS